MEMRETPKKKKKNRKDKVQSGEDRDKQNVADRHYQRRLIKKEKRGNISVEKQQQLQKGGN